MVNIMSKVWRKALKDEAGIRCIYIGPGVWFVAGFEPFDLDAVDLYGFDGDVFNGGLEAWDKSYPEHIELPMNPDGSMNIDDDMVLMVESLGGSWNEKRSSLTQFFKATKILKATNGIMNTKDTKENCRETIESLNDTPCAIKIPAGYDYVVISINEMEKM